MTPPTTAQPPVSPEKRAENLQWLHDTLKEKGMAYPDFLIAAADLVRQTPLFFWHQQGEEDKDKSQMRMDRAKKAFINQAQAHHLSFPEHLIVLLHMLERAGFYIIDKAQEGMTGVPGSQQSAR